MVLLLVLIVSVVLALSAYTFCDLMLTHYEGAQYAGRATQARLLVDSGIDRTRAMLALPRDSLFSMGGVYNNPAEFQAVNAAPNADPQLNGAYTIIAPMVNEEGYYEGIRFGLEDLSTRLNLNYLVIADTLQEGAGRALLLSVPGMTEDVADAILDFIDSDEIPRDFGAENDYYSGLGYSAKNGPLDTLEELLEVRGVTPSLLYGLDINRNGVIDPYEQSLSSGGFDPGLERGWAPYITLASKEANRSANGLQRVYVNEEDLQLLSDNLSAAEVPEEWITFVLAMRTGSPYTGEDEGEYVSSGKFDLTAQGNNNITQILDLVGSKVQVTFDGSDEAVILNSPAALELGALNLQLPVIMDKLTVNPGTELPGRININQASRAVLLGIPGMTEELADMILQARVGNEETDNANFQFETWLLTEGVLLTDGLDENGEIPGMPDLEKMKLLSPYICAGGDVYAAQVIGFFQEGAVSSRVEVVFDGTSPTMTVLLWRDLSHLGRGFSVDVLGVGGVGLGVGSSGLNTGAGLGGMSGRGLPAAGIR
ncbi:MAG: general secretion pathway protein GspK [Planctomycetales bacterium]|nr:general secretion pathway protein GspK [Planctomycetales bacterium]